MRKIKLFFDRLDYVVVRLLMLALLVLGAISLLTQHWHWH
jgi:hypothetical protein